MVVKKQCRGLSTGNIFEQLKADGTIMVETKNNFYFLNLEFCVYKTKNLNMFNTGFLNKDTFSLWKIYEPI